MEGGWPSLGESGNGVRSFWSAITKQEAGTQLAGSVFLRPSGEDANGIDPLLV